jgi:signal transduction histidine kinase
MIAAAENKAKILLVDDNRAFLNSMSEILQEMAGYQVFCEHDPQRALPAAFEINPDAIVLDVYMPGLRGPEICALLKRSPELRHIPILFLTAVGSDARFRARCLDGGADDFLQKPVSSEELMARLRVLLRVKSLQDELRRERDELEQKAQERARELERSKTLAAIGKMVAGVAHEIRNPLSAISNSAAVLSRDLVLEGEDHKLMEIIVREANRLRLTINEFLSFAHPQPCQFVPLALGAVIEDVVFLASRDPLCTARVHIQSDMPEDLPLVEADKDRLHQVLWNLVRNSLEASKGQGEISVTATRESRAGREGVAIRVSDDGPGIAASDRELVFEPFFTRKVRGSGLGLAMVHSAVGAHGGSVHLASDAGALGCTFHLWLPLKQEQG